MPSARPGRPANPYPPSALQVGDSRLDFVYRGRTLIEVKCPLDALPLGGDGGEDSRAPNARLLAAEDPRPTGHGAPAAARLAPLRPRVLPCCWAAT